MGKVLYYTPEIGKHQGKTFVAYPRSEEQARILSDTIPSDGRVPLEFVLLPMSAKCPCGSRKRFKRCCHAKLVAKAKADAAKRKARAKSPGLSSQSSSR